ncbi:hypothetical protein TSUD_270390 [Trifolium subterraneum]|uniref:Formin-like protein n=1 Tax=Trifolium subterraneum TaxID=3900 RepID=A0A2Z6NTL6_TRISU|nr:hypothetical protein TSUD_270390 [Trifolium subterraneum]
MEVTRIRGSAVVYVILLCALAQGGSEGNKEDDHQLLLSFLQIHGKQEVKVWKHCMKELIVRKNDVEESSGMKSILSIQNHEMKRKVLDCVKTSATPPAPVIEVQSSSRYLLKKHSRSSVALKNDHRHHHQITISSISESRNNYIPPLSPMSPSPSANSPSPKHKLVAEIRVSTPASASSSSPSPSPSPESASPPSPTPDTGFDYLPVPPESSLSSPPPPSKNKDSSKKSKPKTDAPTRSPSSNKESSNKESSNNESTGKDSIILAVVVSAIIMFIGFSLCVREAKKDDGPLLVLTSSDYPGAPSPAPPPPLAPRPPPPPRAGHPPPAPPKPMAGKNKGTPLEQAKKGSSSEGDSQKPKLKPFFWEKIIDPRKAQNLSILLRALNVTTVEVIDALNEGNEIPLELIQTLLKMAPTQEEELKLRLFSGELTQLGPAERFLKVLVEIPFAFQRLECLMFMLILREEVTSIKDSFATLEVACDKLRKSRLFLKLLEAVLKTGNRMNDGTYRGGAQAFRLDTLLKLSDVKGTDGKTTLLHFVVQETIRSEGIRVVRTERASRSISSVGTDDVDYENENTEEHYRSLGLQVVSSLNNELEDVRKAALIDGDAITSTVLKLGHSLVKTQEFMNNEFKNLEGTEFQSCLEKFMDHAKVEVMFLVEEEKRIMALVKSTADFFHGNAGKDEGLRLFTIVRDFLFILDKVCKEVKEAALKAMKESAKKEALSASVPSSSNAQNHQPSPSQQPAPPSDLHRRVSSPATLDGPAQILAIDLKLLCNQQHGLIDGRLRLVQDKK